MNLIDSIILTSIGSIFTFICAQKWIFPLLGKLLSWIKDKKKELDEHNIDATESILELKKGTIEVTERQFEVLLNQISSLENQLNEYAKELQELRNTILKLNSKLYQKSLVIAELQNRCCGRDDCLDRISCKNYLCDMIETEEDVKN